MSDSPVLVHHGDCLDVLSALDDASVDAVVTDPPYGLSFMGRGWDHAVPGPEYWAACLRVLKPGGHLLAFGGTRTAHRMACAIEDAGFEIRDSITWLYGSGFPKSLDVGKAIDKAAGATREVVGTKLGQPGYSLTNGNGDHRTYGRGLGNTGSGEAECAVTAPATDAARQWHGWGTALKPASEPIVVARKPLVGTVAANVLAHGTGALNVDACRVETGDDLHRAVGGGGSLRFDGFDTLDDLRAAAERGERTPYGRDAATTLARALTRAERMPAREQAAAGRWPANVVLTHAEACGVECVDGCPVAELDAQSGTLTSGKMLPTRPKGGNRNTYGQDAAAGYTTMETYGDSGGASRFFPAFRYQAKAPTRERPKVDGVAHPTVKPLALMRWLVRLVTPPGGTILDPFAGSGTTGEAAALEGFRAVLVEREESYLPLIAARLERAEIAHELVVAPVVEPEPEPVAVLNPLLASIAAAPDEAAIEALWEAHEDAWTDEHTAAVRARLADLAEQVAA